MDNNHVLRAERAIDTLYSWLFNTRPFSTPPSAASQAASVASPYIASFLHSDKIDTPYFSDNNLDGRYSRNLLSTLSQFFLYPGRLWGQWSPDATLDSFLWNYTPDIYALQKRLGLETLSETYNIDPRIILSILVQLLLLLLLMTCVVMGASNSFRGADYSGCKTDPTVTTSKAEGDAASKKTLRKDNLKGENDNGRAANSGVKDSDRLKQDISRSHLIGNNQDLSSWSALIGSAGFFSGQMTDYKPIDVYATKKSIPSRVEQEKTEDNSWGSKIGALGFFKGDTSNHKPYKHLAGKDLGQLLDRNRALVQDASTTFTLVDKHISYADMVKKPIAGARATEKVDQANEKNIPITSEDGSKIKLDAAEESKAAKAKGSVVHSSETLRTHSPQPNGSSKESDRPEISLSPARQGEDHESTSIGGRDLGSRILGYAQSSHFLRHVDILSGGILGTAIATVAVLATTAETTARLIKENLPNTVVDFTEELKDSFDRALQAELPEYSSESDDETWVIHQVVSQILQEDSQAATSFKSASTKSPTDDISSAAASTQTTCSQPRAYATYARVAAAGIALAEERELFGDNISVGSNLTKVNAAAVAGEDEPSEDGSVTVSGAASPAHVEVNPPLGSCSTDTDTAHRLRDFRLKEDDGAEADDDEPQAKHTHDDNYKDDTEGEGHDYDEDTGDDDNVDDGSVHEHHIKHGWDEENTGDDDNVDDGSVREHHIKHHHHHHGHHTHHLVVHPHDDIDIILKSHHNLVGQQPQTPEAIRANAENEQSAQDYTVDEQGNKVDERRDSGFDMLC
ncbi:hypothetical protein EDD21DRAFT_78755 [Dissophora ornata]|nr:hypothetical protein EDD21DRAFT_78755 [Dissophora ornata]